jgi:hypothetical protein
VKQWDDFARDLIGARDPIRFVEVARAARKRAVRLIVGTVSRRWDDVLNLEWEIENCFRIPAILTPMTGPLTLELIERVHQSRFARAGGLTNHGNFGHAITSPALFLDFTVPL